MNFPAHRIASQHVTARRYATLRSSTQRKVLNFLRGAAQHSVPRLAATPRSSPFRRAPLHNATQL